MQSGKLDCALGWAVFSDIVGFPQVLSVHDHFSFIISCKNILLGAPHIVKTQHKYGHGKQIWTEVASSTEPLQVQVKQH